MASSLLVPRAQMAAMTEIVVVSAAMVSIALWVAAAAAVTKASAAGAAQSMAAEATMTVLTANVHVVLKAQAFTTTVIAEMGTG